jgi:hypothetical protein
MITIEDRAELEDLHSRFIHASDRRDYALLRGLYADGAREEHGAFNGPKDDFVDWLQQVHDHFVMVTHVITNLLFSVDGDVAESEGRGCTYLTMKAARPYNMIVINRHFDRCRKIDGRWRFTSRSLCLDWVQQFPPPEAELDLVKANPLGRMGSDDPVYSKVPHLIVAMRVGLPPLV